MAQQPDVMVDAEISLMDIEEHTVLETGTGNNDFEVGSRNQPKDAPSHRSLPTPVLSNMLKSGNLSASRSGPVVSLPSQITKQNSKVQSLVR